MKKLLLLSSFSVFLYAGFWSSVAGGVVANSLTNSSGGNLQEKLDSRQTDEMKIQQALYGLGYYDSKLDGNLNTMDSRMAINKFQETNNLKVTGIIGETNKQHLLYLHELYTSLISTKNINKEKRNQIYDEIDKAIDLIKGAN